nr:hypothetical protein [Entomoplasma sp. MP1]
MQKTLKNESANALLKFLEEPPANTIAILLTKIKVKFYQL